MQRVFSILEDLDWSNFEEVSVKTQVFLKELSINTYLLKNLLDNVVDNKSLLPLCEKYDFLYKVALYQDAKIQVRFHLFSPEYANRLHYHRWTYSSIILRGGYRHFLYGREEEFNMETDLKSLNPIMIREEVAGSIYTLNHNIVHSVEAQPNTLSLIVRGPAVKERFLVVDKKTNTRWWQYGSKNETYEERKEKMMDENGLVKAINDIKQILDI